MNYFELYGLPLSFHPDTNEVKRKFYELSKKYHPDRYTLADEMKQAEALQKAALNNMAYKTLVNEDATLHYVLKIKGVIEDEEKYTLPPDFLMDMMDLNESVSEYEMAPDEERKKSINVNWQSHSMQLGEEITSATKAYDLQSDDTILIQLKDLYYRKKYLLRIQERINTFAAH